MEATIMKPVGLISAGVLLLILGAAAPTHARQDGHEEDSKAPKQEQPAKPEKQPEQKQTEPAKQEEKPQAKDQQGQPEKQQQAKQQQDKTQQEQAKSNTDHQQQAAESNQQAKTQQAKSQQSQQGQHVQRTAAEQQTQRAVPALRLSARGNGRIPDDRFRSNFGSGHEFRIGSPQMVGGYSRFQYGGYWFGFVQPWPVAWYYTDDVYVDYIDGGYYLYNPSYPGTRISINVVI
jgi:hypothetical protein